MMAHHLHTEKPMREIVCFRDIATSGENIKRRQEYKFAATKLRICAKQVNRFYIGSALFLKSLAIRRAILKMKKSVGVNVGVPVP
jgi:hypothetical protein